MLSTYTSVLDFVADPPVGSSVQDKVNKSKLVGALA